MHCAYGEILISMPLALSSACRIWLCEDMVIMCNLRENGSSGQGQLLKQGW